MIFANDWEDYELLDACGGEKLERFGEYIVIRPDPQVIWRTEKSHPGWRNAHMHYHRSPRGGGSWQILRPVPERWEMGYNGLRFYIRPTEFKHMGIFPEQAANWRWITDKIRNAERPVRVLNLFAYTGGATLAAAAAGAAVCHVDAAKAMNGWAKENLALSGLTDAEVRFLTDDVSKLTAREKRRGNTYDAIIMDPPAYGRGPKAELWKLEDELFSLVETCAGLLTDNPLFMLINAYTAGFSHVSLGNLLSLLGLNGEVKSGELGLRSESGIVLPCGVYGRFEGWGQANGN